MARIAIFSDLHDDLNTLERLMRVEADYYIAAGDLSNFGRELDRMGAAMRPKADRVWVLPGNHESESQVAALCDRFGFHPFHQQSFVVDGWNIAGLGYSSPTPFNTVGEYSEPQLAVRLEPFAELDPLVLVCHCPPLGTALDHAGRRRHYGSSAVRDFVLKKQPAYFFCGHIHEAEGAEEQIGPTFARNVGRRGYLLDLKPRAETSGDRSELPSVDA